jgi:small neutral amino acid transporter SnatA (MarC family)
MMFYSLITSGVISIFERDATPEFIARLMGMTIASLAIQTVISKINKKKQNN